MKIVTLLVTHLHKMDKSISNFTRTYKQTVQTLGSAVSDLGLH